MSAPTRAGLARRALVMRAVADEARARAEAARAQLEEIALAELARDGTAPTWRIPGVGTVPLSLAQPAVEVVDPAAYLAWVTRRYPDEVETARQVRPAFDAHVRRAAALRGAPCDDEGEVIPGLAYRPGGTPRGVSVRPDPDARAEAAAAAAHYLDSLEVPDER